MLVNKLGELMLINNALLPMLCRLRASFQQVLSIRYLCLL